MLVFTCCQRTPGTQTCGHHLQDDALRPGFVIANPATAHTPARREHSTASSTAAHRVMTGWIGVNSLCLVQVGAFSFLTNGGGKILFRILPFRLWPFFATLGTRMDEHRDAFAKVSILAPGGHNPGLRPGSRTMQEEVYWFPAIAPDMIASADPFWSSPC